MARNILKSNNSIILATESPAFSTGDQSGILFGGVVGSSFDFNIDRQTAKQIGSQELSYNTMVRQPDVTFSTEYIFIPLLFNEQIFGLSSDSSAPYAASGLEDVSVNFCYLNHPDQGFDAIDQYFDATPDFSGYEAISIGNAYLTSYSVDYAIGSLPIAKASFDASNIKYETVTGSSIQSPAINLQSGNNNQVGDIIISGFDDLPNRFNIDAIRPDAISLSLQNLQVGGQNLSGYHFVQNLNMSLDLERTPLYGFGSDYVYERKLQYPILGNISISSLVSGFEAGEASGILPNESGYNFEVGFEDYKGSYTGKFIIEDARLNSYSYSMDVNNQMSFDASFSFEVTENKGLRISGYNSLSDDAWSLIPDMWSFVEEIWSEA
jgi:hypothetical protein